MDNYGQLIRQARLARNVSQVELAKRLGIASANACRLEAGRNSPSLRTLERVALALGISLGELLSTSIPVSEKTMPVVRETGEPRLEPILAGKSLGNLSLAARRAVLKREKEYVVLEHELGIPTSTVVQLALPLDTTRGGAEAAARYVRSSCDAGTSTLADLSSLLEFRGLRIHFTQLPSQVPSLAFFDPDHRTFSILLNDGDTPERHTFRLAYELGTACLFASRGYELLKQRSLAHRFAHDFAAAFLMPAEAVRSAVAQTGLIPTRWNLAALIALKTRFNVSAEAFALRLEELDLVKPDLRHRFRDDLRAYYSRHPHAMEPPPCLKPLVRYSRLEVLREALRMKVTRL